MNDEEKFDFNGRDFNGYNFNGWNFNGYNFNGYNFNGWNFNGYNFNGWNFNGYNFNGRDFNGNNFDGNNFNGNDFNGWNFDGKKVSYWAFFNCYGSIKCESIEGRRTPHSEPICLDGKLEIKDDTQETIKIGDQIYNKQEVEEALKNVKSIK